MQDSTTKLIQRNFRQGGGKGAEAVGPFFSITVSGCYDLFACLRDIRRSTAPRGSRAFFSTLKAQPNYWPWGNMDYIYPLIIAGLRIGLDLN